VLVRATASGMLLEVCHLVGLVDDFEAKDGFDDVLKGDKPDGSSELIGDQHDLIAVSDETLEQSIEGLAWGR
jgi:hypothetical protein